MNVSTAANRKCEVLAYKLMLNQFFPIFRLFFQVETSISREYLTECRARPTQLDEGVSHIVED
jgi:hypothetical protein